MSSTLANITVFFQFIQLFPNSLGLLEWYYDGLGIEYQSLNTFMWLACWGLLVLTFGTPFSMFVYQEVTLPPPFCR